MTYRFASSAANRASASEISSRSPASVRGSFANRRIVRIRRMRCRSQDTSSSISFGTCGRWRSNDKAPAPECDFRGQGCTGSDRGEGGLAPPRNDAPTSRVVNCDLSQPRRSRGRPSAPILNVFALELHHLWPWRFEADAPTLENLPPRQPGWWSSVMAMLRVMGCLPKGRMELPGRRRAAARSIMRAKQWRRREVRMHFRILKRFREEQHPRRRGPEHSAVDEAGSPR